MKYPDTKKRILKKAFEFFSTNGYSGTSIRQISRSLGIRESAIYNHYKSKEEIFLSIIEQFKKESIGISILSDDLLEELDNPEKFLKDFSKRLIDHWNKPEERKFIRLLLMEQFTKTGSHVISVSDYLTELKSICKMIFNEMMKAGIIKHFDPELIVHEFIAPLFLIRAEKLSSDDSTDIKEIYNLTNMHIDYFWNAIKLKK